MPDVHISSVSDQGVIVNVTSFTEIVWEIVGEAGQVLRVVDDQNVLALDEVQVIELIVQIFGFDLVKQLSFSCQANLH